MKKFTSLMIVLMMLLLMLSVPTFGSEEDRYMKIVSCPEQDFSTVCRPECTYDFTPDGGLSIQLDETDVFGSGYISIFKTDAPGTDFDAETYFNNAYLNLLESRYGTDLLDPGEYTVYSFAGKELPGRLAVYMKNGEPHMCFCLYDLEDDYFVRYEAFSLFEESVMQSAIDDLSDAVRYFQPDAMFYYDEDDAGDENETKAQEPDSIPDTMNTSRSDQQADQIAAAANSINPGVEVYLPSFNVEEAEAGPNFQIIRCTAEGFSTHSYNRDMVEYKDSTGVTCFLDSDGPTIWIRIQRLPYESDFDTEAYFRDEVTPDMEYIYTDCNYSEREFDDWVVDYKYVEGKEYEYSLNGYNYVRRVMICKGEDDIVRFEAVYTDDTFDRVMGDLKLAVTNYIADPDAYTRDGGVYLKPEAKPEAESAPEPRTEPQVESIPLQTIACPELGFSVKADPAYSWGYEDGNGIYIYTGPEGSIPYVLVYQSEDLYMEPYEYIVEQYTPHMEQKYGSDLVDADEYEYYELGEKQLPVGIYTYNVDGHTIKQIRVMDSTGPQTVFYTAKFEGDYDSATLDALNTAIRTFERY